MGLLGWLFRPRRSIFAARVGGTWRYYDPADVRDRLNEAEPRWGELVDVAVKSARPLPAALDAPAEVEAKRAEEAADATNRLAAAVCVAFGVTGLRPDGSGMTRAERVSLLAAYLSYCADLMRATRPLPGSPPATASAGGGSASGSSSASS